jgi:tRNA pseudouridine32 synthase / 23S rRNA pseudouridine746 synthase
MPSYKPSHEPNHKSYHATQSSQLPASEASLDPLQLASRVLHRDESMLILNKPPGIAVHRGAGAGDNLEAYFEVLRLGAIDRPSLAHRLDKDTSGCLVLGRHKEALARLGLLFRRGFVEKTYWAVVMGRFPASTGVIDAPLARRSHDRRSWWMMVDPAGDASVTHWTVLGEADGLSFVELKPQTGRTHQLRVHCAHLGAPIAGDHVYGGDRARAGARHLHLHARAIMVPYERPNPVSVIAPAPAHMHDLLMACGWQES